jgi:hypothetical protein
MITLYPVGIDLYLVALPQRGAAVYRVFSLSVWRAAG